MILLGAFRNSWQQVGRDPKCKLPRSGLEGILVSSGAQFGQKPKLFIPCLLQHYSHDYAPRVESTLLDLAGSAEYFTALTCLPSWRTPVPFLTHTSVPAVLVLALPACQGHRQPVLLVPGSLTGSAGHQPDNAAGGCFASRAGRTGRTVEGDWAAPEGAVTSPSSAAVCQAKHSPWSQHWRPWASATVDRQLSSKPVPFSGCCCPCWQLSRTCGHFCGCTEPAQQWEETGCALASLRHLADVFGSRKTAERRRGEK